MSKVIACAAIILFVIRQTPPIRAETLFEVATGQERSSTNEFVQELGELWKGKNLDLPVSIRPLGKISYEDRFAGLIAGTVKLGILPLNMIDDKSMETNNLRVVLVLWRSYLFPFTAEANPKTVTVADERQWRVPKGSLIIPAAFPNRQLELVDLSDLAIQIKEPLEGLYLYEMAGPAWNMVSRLPTTAGIPNFSNRLLTTLLSKLPYLEKQTVNFKRAKISTDLNTVSVRLALFGHAELDADTMEKLVRTAVDNAGELFARPYLFRLIDSSLTKGISQSKLHLGTRQFLGLITKEVKDEEK